MSLFNSSWYLFDNLLHVNCYTIKNTCHHTIGYLFIFLNFFLILTKGYFSLDFQRKGKGEVEIETEKHWCERHIAWLPPSRAPPGPGLSLQWRHRPWFCINLKPRHMPLTEIETETLQSTGRYYLVSQTGLGNIGYLNLRYEEKTNNL